MPKLKRNGKIALALVGALAMSILALELLAERWVERFLERKLPAHIVYSFEDVDAAFFSGRIRFVDLKMDIYNRDVVDSYAQIELNELELDGFSYWKFWFDNTIHADDITLDHPLVTVSPYKKVKDAPDQRKGVVDLKKDISLSNFQVKGGELVVYQEKRDSLLFAARAIDFELRNAKTDSLTITKRIPLEYTSHSLGAKEIKIDLSEFEYLELDELMMEDAKITLSDLLLSAKHSKADHSEMVSQEKEHLNIEVPQITLQDLDYGFEADTFFFSLSDLIVDSAQAFIHLDKRLNKRRAHVNLYSKVIRELPIHMRVDSVHVNNSFLEYEEWHEKTDPSSIFFDQMNVSIAQLGNDLESGGKTSIHAECGFMGKAPMQLDWAYDVTNVSDELLVSGEVQNLEVEAINDFLISTANITAKGSLDALYFTFSGDDNASTGDLKMSYEDFELTAFKENRRRVSALKTFIGNLLVKNGDNADAEGFRHGAIAAQRDKQKSFFNYLWISVQSGLEDALKGDGEKG